MQGIEILPLHDHHPLPTKRDYSMRIIRVQRTVNWVWPLLAFCTAVGLSAQEASTQTLKAVKERGALLCGINPGLLGFSNRDGQNNWTGFDVDFCRALAAAIFNDASKVRFVPLDTTDRLSALQAGNIDVLSRNTTWTMSREASLDLNFATVTYYDGQGFLVRRARNVISSLELNGSSVCVQTGTTTELNLADYFRDNNMNYQVLPFATSAEAVAAYDTGRCSVLSSDIAQLFAERLNLAAPDDHTILPDIISKEPLGPAVRFGDDRWLNIVKWTHFAMINAEELGVSSETIDVAEKSRKPDVMRLVGTEGNYGEQIGLTKDWAVRIIRQVGNYGEVFERNVGIGSKLGIPRGINSLWTKGGIQYAPPIR
jgi:general L-amino acid transport system substrate-binding protein